MIKKPFELLEKLNFIKENNHYYKKYQGSNVIKVTEDGIVDFGELVFVEGNEELLINKLEVHTLIAFIDLYYFDYFSNKPKIILNKKFSVDNQEYGFDVVVGDIGVIFENQFADCLESRFQEYIEKEHPLIKKLFISKEIDSLLTWRLLVDENGVGYNEIITSISGIIESYKWKRRCPPYAGSLKEQITRRKALMEKLKDIKMFKFIIGNAFQGYKKFVIEFDKETVEIKDNCFYKKENKDLVALDIKNEILKLFLFNWKKEYISSVSKDDPISWELSLTFNEYEPIMYRGVEEYPLNIEDVYDFINKYSDILLDKEEK